jgi:tyrosyl-tRNA synthetase
MIGLRAKRREAREAMANDVYQEFEWRGMVYEGTEGVRDLLAREKVTCYIGFDPTAASLHVGSLLPLMALARLQRFGHSPIGIAGGGTGMVGDPSGKTQERQLMSLEQIEENLKGIRGQLERFLDFDASPNPARIVNNADWLAKLNLMEFLRDIGKHFTVNGMLAKESVRRRIESEDGISYTEFTYSLLQAYDFLMMFDRYRCTLQLGGSDQWGNIIAGADLIRKLRGGKAHGLVMPLVTTAAGVKFGKTEAGAVWLDPALTSDFRFYQFWLTTDDRDTEKYLKFFTFLGADQIGALARELEAAPEKRAAQRELAREVTRLVRGEEAVARAERASAILFGGHLGDAKADDVLEVFADVPSTEIEAERFVGPGLAISELVALTGLTASKGEAARAIKGGGIYVNDGRVTDERGRLTLDQAIDGRLFVLRKGQRSRHVVRVRESR